MINPYLYLPPVLECRSILRGLMARDPVKRLGSMVHQHTPRPLRTAGAAATKETALRGDSMRGGRSGAAARV